MSGDPFDVVQSQPISVEWLAGRVLPAAALLPFVLAIGFAAFHRSDAAAEASIAAAGYKDVRILEPAAYPCPDSNDGAWFRATDRTGRSVRAIACFSGGRAEVHALN